jgi:small subunit ribosomal protein S17
MMKTKRKLRTGIVISDKMKKTIIVGVSRLTKHPLYGKIIKKSNKFKVHDEKNTAKVGDTVRIQETRPLSKDKRWKLVEVIKKAQPDIALKPDKPE